VGGAGRRDSAAASVSRIVAERNEIQEGFAGPNGGEAKVKIAPPLLAWLPTNVTLLKLGLASEV
jgi:hypothetical protein